LGLIEMRTRPDDQRRRVLYITDAERAARRRKSVLESERVEQLLSRLSTKD
jgi:DNA-binding MarR family transcriptional regulator